MSRIVGTLVIALILVVSGPSVSLAGGYGDLVVQWAGVVDNGEGDNWPHGPFGSLHILIYEVNRFGGSCPGNWKSYPRPLRHVYLYGPSNGEWRDGDMVNKDALELFDWRSRAPAACWEMTTSGR